ncbi:uncharacterized protein IWZ02DRAFT_488353 [Phyllosticta citriasiana]|uniref:Uncharacterized protein n=1 Tax=Phyllosticta citriasiana TaxID=595635 RepID=A0ABR1KID9_9PEZI
MSSSAISSSELASSLSNLKLSTDPTILDPKPAKKSSGSKINKNIVADSWEDDLSESSGSDTEIAEDVETTTPHDTLQRQATEGPLAPPPTPASPLASTPAYDTPYKGIDAQMGAAAAERESGRDVPARRPEKTTAVAARMIAGGLGIRAPRRTEEEREFDRAAREKERKRRERERDQAVLANQKEEAAKKSVWED